jgi:phosphotransferase system enzyme I (PtsI)
MASGEAVFAAHLEMVGDPVLDESVRAHIASGEGAEKALEAACGELCAMFESIEDDYLRERVTDLRDICSRIGRALSGDTGDPFGGADEGTIFIADEITPSDTVAMDLGRTAGFVTARGSVGGHACIIARSKGIPAAVGAGDAIGDINDGDVLILDGAKGVVIVRPTDDVLLEYLDKSAPEVAEDDFCGGCGGRVAVMANAGSVEEVRLAMEAGAAGIGLFRSEFLFFGRGGFPTEEQQYEAYRDATVLCGGKPLTIRTLDIGGDKPLPYMDMPREDNPMLGWRGIRVSLAREDIFRTQLRAILRAGAHGNIRVMFPMVVSVAELRRANEIMRECAAELAAEGAAHDDAMAVGVMIETPAAVMLAPEMAREAAFFSVGTNDLTQYMMAADRTNPLVAAIYDPNGAAVLRAVGQVVEAGHEAGIEVGVCGESASDPAGALLLVGAGVDELSVGVHAVARVKRAVGNN